MWYASNIPLLSSTLAVCWVIHTDTERERETSWHVTCKLHTAAELYIDSLLGHARLLHLAVLCDFKENIFKSGHAELCVDDPKAWCLFLLWCMRVIRMYVDWKTLRHKPWDRWRSMYVCMHVCMWVGSHWNTNLKIAEEALLHMYVCMYVYKPRDRWRSASPYACMYVCMYVCV